MCLIWKKSDSTLLLKSILVHLKIENVKEEIGHYNHLFHV